jgi:hypothetical protein
MLSQKKKIFRGLEVWLKWWSACLALPSTAKKKKKKEFSPKTLVICKLKQLFLCGTA